MRNLIDLKPSEVSDLVGYVICEFGLQYGVDADSIYSCHIDQTYQKEFDSLSLKFDHPVSHYYQQNEDFSEKARAYFKENIEKNPLYIEIGEAWFLKTEIIEKLKRALKDLDVNPEKHLILMKRCQYTFHLRNLIEFLSGILTELEEQTA